MSTRANSRSSANTIPGRSNPRRRTRQEIDGTSSLRLPRAKRNKIDNGTIQQIEHAFSNARVSEDGNMNGHATPDAPLNGTREELELDASDTHMHIDFPSNTDALLRSYSSRGEGPSLLTKTDSYVASKLPSFPAELEHSSHDFHSSILVSAALAVAVTRKQAFVWDYTLTAYNCAARVLSLPNPVADDEPLPVAAIVKTGPTSNTGLVVISPRSGQVTFWEDIDNAAALSLFEQRRNGTEGSLGSMMSGEVVTEIVHADPAGYVVVLSSGRVAQLCLWDSQSRPAISVRFLKSSKANSGYFGGIWNALGIGGFLRDVVAVRAQVSDTRASADVFVGSEQFIFQRWQLSGPGLPSFVSETNARERSQAVITETLQSSLPSRIQSIALADFLVESQSSDSLHLICVVSVRGSDFESFTLMDLHFSDRPEPIECSNVFPLNAGSPSLIKSSRDRPKLASPANSSAIFVALDHAVVIASKGSSRFQDSVYLRDDQDIHISSLTAEPFENHQHDAASVILMLTGHGSIRFSALETIARASHARISARTKIEQAIFFGTKPKNPFNLARGPELRHPIEQVEKAAVDVSNDILCSRYPSLLPSLASMEQDLGRRRSALADLANHLKLAHPGVSRVTKWTLLSNAEKLEAAQTAWSYHESQLHGHGHPSRLLREIVECMHADIKSFSEDSLDQLRSFFRHDLGKVSNLIVFCYQVIHFIVQREGEGRTSVRLAQLVCNAGDMVVGMLDAAYNFRQQNAWQYGLEGEALEEGVLRPGTAHAGLPQFWTSTHLVLTKLMEFIKGVQELSTLIEPDDGIPRHLAEKMDGDNPAVLAVWSKGVEERHAWSQAQGASVDAKVEKAHYRHYGKARTTFLSTLSKLDQTDAGMILAEKYQDMDALTKLLKARSGSLQASFRRLEEGPSGESSTQRATRSAKLVEEQNAVAALEERFRGYCKAFGPSFTNTYFSAMVKQHCYRDLFVLSSHYRGDLTNFLRSERSLSKLSWINDVLSEKDYGTASQSLVWTVQHRQSASNKKTYTAHAKLAMLAAAEDGATNLHLAESQDIVAAEAELSEIQRLLYEHIESIVRESLDREAALQELMKHFATSKVKVPEKGQMAARSLLRHNFNALIEHEALDAERLADTLTLMDIKDCADDSERHIEADAQYSWALRALAAGSRSRSISEERLEMARRIMWRRVYIEIDWATVIATAEKNDEEVEATLQDTVLFKTFIESIEHGLLSSSVIPPTASEVANAGTSPADLHPRFGEGQIAQHLSSEMKAEAMKLTKLVKESEIDSWIRAIFELALRMASETSSFADHDRETQIQYAVREMALETGAESQEPIVNGMSDAMDMDGVTLNGQ